MTRVGPALGVEKGFLGDVLAANVGLLFLYI